MEREEYAGVDIIRFVMALLIVALHLHPLLSCNKYLDFGLTEYVARLGVPFFFFVTGYFGAKKMIVAKSELEVSSWGVNSSYATKYIGKVLRLYIIWNIIYLPLVIFNNDIKDVGLLHFILRYIRNFCLSGTFSHLWYLNAVLLDMIIIVITIKFGLKIKTIVKISFVLYLIGLTCQSYYGFFAPLLNNKVFSCIINYLSLFFPTARNFLFFGLFFIGTGFYCSMIGFNMNLLQAIKAFLISMVALFAEIFILEFNNIIRAYDMYLMLIPSAISLFYIGLNVPIKPNYIFYKLRIYANLIFYLHLGVSFILEKLFPFIKNNSIFKYFLCVIICIAIGILLEKLASFKKLRFLRLLYS